MSKATQVQRPLFGPWLAWDQLPDSVREQALDVLTAIYLEIVDASRIGEQTTHDLSTAEGQSASIPEIFPAWSLNPMTHPLIKPYHLERSAYVYLRQSSPGQVRKNREGRQRQQAMVEHVAGLGWPQSRIILLDQDTGQSGSSQHGRSDLHRLLEAIVTGNAGLGRGPRTLAVGSRQPRLEPAWFGSAVLKTCCWQTSTGSTIRPIPRTAWSWASKGPSTNSSCR